eukprot:CAMPEP_0202715414 /NCGR_PEP_ID=MMETSP1385-20130828/89486_1 /ASSEMBLY_ACC=CAM_ASM_000861 /TAXON_ID=933848 /ORGANISM="Elphidium margaritaceum" /LENGTH=114 /DNA_ID=CAMNT_0049376657 /DNA_START=99 /DNA_END=439 /DNA_ORIENTATION=+
MLDTIKTAVRESDHRCDDDVLSIIMSYLMGYHDVLQSFFSVDDDAMMRMLMVEASEASDGWIDILRTILSKDDTYGKLYEERVFHQPYREHCPTLGLLSYRLYSHKYDIEQVKT